MALVLAAAALIRLWQFDTPSLWFDEALVAMVAKLPVDSVIRRALMTDFHPPAYYLLTKLMLAVGDDDAVLRAPSLIFGLGGVWLAWWTGRSLWNARIGLSMAAVVAVLPWHVLLSRQLRPYAIIFFFSLLAFSFTCRYAREKRTRDAAWAALALWPPLLLNHGALLCAGGAGLALLAASIGRAKRLLNVLAFGLLCLVPVAANLPFLLASLGHERGLEQPADRGQLALTCLVKLSELLFRENIAWARLALAASALAGLALLLRRDRPLAQASAIWLAAPLAALVVVGYGSYFNPWHLIFLLPVAAVWLGWTLSLLPGPLPPLALCFATAWLYLGFGAPAYYQEQSYTGTAKAAARLLAGSGFPGKVYVYPEAGVVSPINWYLDRFSDPNPLRAQRLTPRDATACVNVPGQGTGCAPLARTPVQELGTLPARHWLTARPADLLSKVSSLENLACMPVLEDILVATQPGVTGFAEFQYRNADPRGQIVTVHFGFSNRLSGNRFTVRCRFDDEPWVAAFESTGPDPRGFDKLVLERRAPYRMLTVRFELRRTGHDPSHTGEDLEAVRMTDFKVEADQAP
ncbi:glycosyltransferase family 39 protein [Fundidesulfovibrio soli]|uniref:glycosyltransferase family 39 protein n=1 Tax=Fundidesulfovibrio soli TaxID=2922716 RepID=UPI001FAEE7F5|nr:glycosyltransferase family 39 protein [Fundidesulfovibrio soli]